MRKRLIAALLCASMAMPAAGETEQIVKAAEQTATAEQTTTTGENTSTGTETGNKPEEKAVSGTYGTNLKWEFDVEKGILYITGNGDMKIATEKQGKTDAPWQEWQTDIKEVVVGDDVTSIAKNVFACLTNLEKVTIGKKVKKIHSTAFLKSQNLSTIEVADGNKYYCASNNILYNKKKTEILFLGNGTDNKCKIPASVKKIYIDHTSSSLEKISVDSKNKVYSAKDGVLFNKKGTELLRCPNGKKGSYKVPAKVKTICEGAFAYCKKLEEVTTADDTGKIKLRAFEDCTELIKVNLGKKVVICDEWGDGDYLGAVSDIFVNCVNLKEINVSASHSRYKSIDGVIIQKYGAEDVLLYYPPGREEKSYIIPEGVTQIANKAFCKCDKLEEVTISDTVESTNGETPFQDCKGIKSVWIGKSLGVYSFKNILWNCPNIENIAISKDNKTIAEKDGMIYQISSEYQMSPEGMRAKKELIYLCKDPEGDYVMPDLVQTIPYDTFANCSKLTSLKLADSLECSSNSRIITTTDTESQKEQSETLEEELESSYNIPYMIGTTDSDDEEKEEVISVNDGNQVIYLPKPDNNLIYNVRVSLDLSNCSSLKKIELGEKIGQFEYVILDDNIEEFVISEKNETLMAEDGIIYQKKEQKLNKCGGGKKGKVTVKEGTKEIADDAFSGCDEIEEIILPDSVEKIGKNAFKGCKNLKKIVLPGSIKKIGGNAFEDCDQLEEIVLPASIEKIGKNTFKGCKNLKKIILPGSIKKIGENAFEDCKSLKSIVLPENVKEIDIQTFYGCEALEDITIQSEALEWVATWALKGISPNAVITVPKGKSEEYRQLFHKKRYQTGFTETMTIKERE